MATRPTITTVVAGKYSTEQLNTNFQALRDAFDVVLGTPGTSGTNNDMSGDLNMNGNVIRNVTFDGSIAGLEWRSAWLTGTAYNVNDLVSFDDGNGHSVYICVVEHTAGVFTTDLNADKWEVFCDNAVSTSFPLTTVLEFGADPTAATDSTSAFQDAVDSGTAILFVPAGTYKIDGTVEITAPIRIMGGGGDQTVTASAVTNIAAPDTSNDIFHINSNNVTIEHLNFHGTGGGTRAATGADAIVIGSDSLTSSALSISSGTDDVTATDVTFTVGDVGKRIYISGAGAGGEPHITFISAFVDATHVTVSDNALTTVTNAGARYGHSYVGVVLDRITTNSFHGIGINFLNAAHFILTNCNLWGTNAAVNIENQVGPDYGDSMIDNCTFYTTSATGKCITWKSSGGLKISNCKFLDAQYHIYMTWDSAVSGNFNLTNCSFENYTGTSFFMSGTKAFRRMNIGNNTFGGQTAIEVSNSGSSNWLMDLVICGNTILVGTAVPGVKIGRCSGFLIDSNIFNGSSIGTYGVVVDTLASSGLFDRNLMLNWATGATQNSSTSTSVAYEEGTWTPTLSYGTPGDLAVGYTTRVGTYTKNGRNVTVNCNIITSSFVHTTASGSLTVTGAPHTSNGDTNNFTFGSCSYQGVTKANYHHVVTRLGSNSTIFDFMASATGQIQINVTAADMPTAGTVILQFTMTYQAAR